MTPNKQPELAAAMLETFIPGWLERFLGGLYKIYFQLLKVQASPHGSEQDTELTDAGSVRYTPSLDQGEIDFRATRVGAAYRGIGILVGILGAAIILCALLPVGLALSTAATAIVGISKVALMVTLVAILFATRKLGLKERWVSLRRAAEYHRYEQLRELISIAGTSKDSASFDALRREVARHIGGGNECQILYNEKKRTDYEGIEAFSTRLTYAAFTASFAGAAAHLVFHASWLIFLTAYVPALVGAMHAVNSFLRLPQLIEQHGEMVLVLSSLREQFPVETSSAESRNTFLQLSQQLLERLQNADVSWLAIASHQNLHPV